MGCLNEWTTDQEVEDESKPDEAAKKAAKAAKAALTKAVIKDQNLRAALFPNNHFKTPQIAPQEMTELNPLVFLEFHSLFSSPIENHH